MALIIAIAIAVEVRAATSLVIVMFDTLRRLGGIVNGSLQSNHSFFRNHVTQITFTHPAAVATYVIRITAP